LFSKKGVQLMARIFDFIEGARILTLVKNGPYGCDLINHLIQTIFKKELNLITLNHMNFFSGEPIIINRNDYSKGLFNGDVGVLIKDANAGVSCFFKRSGEIMNFHKESLPQYSSAFAMTIHRSQGSEFNDVLLILLKEAHHKLLSREIVYTGITRTKDRLTLYGTGSVLEKAVKRRIKRYSGLRW